MDQLLIKILIGSNKKYGLQVPDHKFGQTHPTINDELLYRIRHGKVHPKVNIERFDGNTVHFVDGTKEDFDVVIACTGFQITHPFFDKDFRDLGYDRGGFLRHKDRDQRAEVRHVNRRGD